VIRKFFRDAKALWLSQTVVRFRGIILIPILTRYLGADSYGAMSQLLALVGLAAVLTVVGTDAGMLREAAGRSLDQQRRYTSAWTIFLLANCTVVAVLLLLFQNTILHFVFDDDERYRSLVLIGGLACFSATFFVALKNWLMLRNRFSVFALAGVAQFVTAVASAFVAIALGQGVTEVVLYMTTGDILVLFAYGLYLHGDKGLNAPDFSVLKPALRYGLPLLPGGFAMLGLNWMDRLFLIHYASLREIGVYAVAYSLGFAVVPVLSDPFRTMFPVLSAQHFNQRKLEELQRMFNYAAGTGLALTIPAVVGLFLLGDAVISIFAPRSYLEGGGLIWIIALGYVFNSFASYYENQLGLVYRQHWSTIAIGCALAVNLALNVILIPRYSIYGAGVATAAGFAVQFAVVYVRSAVTPVLQSDHGFVLKILACSLAMGVCLSLLKSAVAPAGLSPLLLVAIVVPAGVVVYTLLLLGTRTISVSLIGAGLSTVFSWRVS
jgi:O-antigen/teichoic acid export membrane protein